MIFQKGLPDQTAAQALRSAVTEGDCNEIAALERGLDSERVHVDTFINGVPRAMRPPRQAMRVPLAQNPEFGSDAFMKETQHLIDLAEMRDEKLENLPLNLPKGLRVLSMYLADEMVPKFEPGKNYGTDKRSWNKIQAGTKFESMPYKKMTKIVTARDAAAYVYADSPIKPWLKLLKSVLEQEIPKNIPESFETKYKGQADFTVFGAPFYTGLLGEALKVSGWVSFATKWAEWVPRPEEAAPAMDMGYLSQAYNEGSPMHPARVAMHTFAALVLMYVLLKMFDRDATLDTGETLDYEARLLKDNIGYFRLHAGVHYASDHLCGDARAEAVADYIVDGYFR